MIRQTLFLAAAAAALACSQPQPPVAATPAPDPDAEAARRDSIAALARADSIARAERTRADQVRDQVQQDSGMVADEVTPLGLNTADSTVLYQRIGFDFDSDRIRPEFEALLAEKLRVLRENPRLEVRIGGHCDDRGSDEYNLVLGQRRAAAVHRWLVNYGINAARLTIMSFGEEQPLDTRASEAGRALNRRADFTVTRPAR